jgi:hypothetical protein
LPLAETVRTLLLLSPFATAVSWPSNGICGFRLSVVMGGEPSAATR